MFIHGPRLHNTCRVLFRGHGAVGACRYLTPLTPRRRPRCKAVMEVSERRPFPTVQTSRVYGSHKQLRTCRVPRAVGTRALVRQKDAMHYLSNGTCIGCILRPGANGARRLHIRVGSLKLPVLNSSFCPGVIRHSCSSFSRPLRLITHRLHFSSPIAKRPHAFISGIPLN